MPKLQKAAIGAPDSELVLSVIEYDRQFGKGANERPFCLVCREQVHTYGLSSPGNRQPHYRHNRGSNCVLVRRSFRHLSWLDRSGYDELSGVRVRRKFCETAECHQRAFEFMRILCNLGAFSVDRFIDCIRIADGLNIWAYRNIKQWMIPFVLLTLTDFPVQNNNLIIWRFIFHRPNRRRPPTGLSKINAIDLEPAAVENNPFPFTEVEYERLSHDFQNLYNETKIGIYQFLNPR